MHNQELVLNTLLIIAIVLLAVNVFVYFYIRNINNRIGRKKDGESSNTKNDEGLIEGKSSYDHKNDDAENEDNKKQ